MLTDEENKYIVDLFSKYSSYGVQINPTPHILGTENTCSNKYMSASYLLTTLH